MLLQHRQRLDFHNPCLACKPMIKSLFGPLSTKKKKTYFTKIYYLVHEYYFLFCFLMDFFIVVDYLVNVVFLVDNLM